MKNIFTLLFIITSMLAFGQKGIKSKKSKLHQGYIESTDGMIYRFYSQNKTGTKPKEGDVVRVAMWYKTNKDSVLYSSVRDSRNGQNYIEFPLEKSQFKGSFEQGLGMMTVGDSASFLVSTDSVFLLSFRAPFMPNYLEKGSLLNFNVKLLHIISKDSAAKASAEQDQQRQAYLAARQLADSLQRKEYLLKNNITTPPTTSGLYYIEQAKGTGSKPVKGCKAKVNYTLRTMDGKVLDSSDKEIARKGGMDVEGRPFEPLDIPMGQGMVIPGFEEALLLMNPGTKALLIIPPYLGYGENGGGPIEPYTTLVFDIELISFDAP